MHICIINGKTKKYQKPNMRNGIWHVFFWCLMCHKSQRIGSYKRIYVWMWQYTIYTLFDASKPRMHIKIMTFSKNKREKTETKDFELNEIAMLFLSDGLGAWICDLWSKIPYSVENWQWFEQTPVIWHFHEMATNVSLCVWACIITNKQITMQ